MFSLFTALLQLRSNHVDMERQAARKFLRDLELFIAGLGNLRSPLEVDLALQQFASDYCEGIYFLEFIYLNVLYI